MDRAAPLEESGGRLSVFRRGVTGRTGDGGTRGQFRPKRADAGLFSVILGVARPYPQRRLAGRFRDYERTRAHRLR